MSANMITLNDVASIKDYTSREEVKARVKANTFMTWADKARKDGSLKPVGEVSGIKVYLITDLAALEASYARKAARPKVDPAQHDEVVERAERLAVEVSRLRAAIEAAGMYVDEFEDGSFVILDNKYRDVKEEPVGLLEYSNA